MVYNIFDTNDITVLTIYPQFSFLKQIISVLTNIANKANDSLAQNSPEIKIEAYRINKMLRL